MSVDTCGNCHLEAPDLRACGYCEAVKYCCEGCQASDWEAHRDECVQRARLRAAVGDSIGPVSPWRETWAQALRRVTPWVVGVAAVGSAVAFTMLRLKRETLRARPRLTPDWAAGL